MLDFSTGLYDICWCTEGICKSKQKVKTRKYQKIPGNQCNGDVSSFKGTNELIEFDLTCEMRDGFNKYIDDVSLDDEFLHVDGNIAKSAKGGSPFGWIFVLLMLGGCVCCATYYERVVKIK